jgi:hypothetical protein
MIRYIESTLSKGVFLCPVLHPVLTCDIFSNLKTKSAYIKSFTLIIKFRAQQSSSMVFEIPDVPVRDSWGSNPTSGLISCATLGKCLKLSETHFFCTLGCLGGLMRSLLEVFRAVPSMP